jgi:hypothetical protein
VGVAVDVGVGVCEGVGVAVDVGVGVGVGVDVGVTSDVPVRVGVAVVCDGVVVVWACNRDSCPGAAAVPGIGRGPSLPVDSTTLAAARGLRIIDRPTIRVSVIAAGGRPPSGDMYWAFSVAELKNGAIYGKVPSVDVRRRRNRSAAKPVESSLERVGRRTVEIGK